MLDNRGPVMGSTSDGVDRQYKCCFIPACYNTSVTTSEKIFFEVPQGPRREEWLRAVGLRVNKSAFLLTTRFYCCSDHFEIPGDTESEGVLKEDAIPHRFRVIRPNVPAQKGRRKWGNVVNVPIWIQEEENSHGTHITNIFEPLVSLQETTNALPVPIPPPNPDPVSYPEQKKRRPHVYNVPIWVRGEDHSCEEVPEKDVVPEGAVKRSRGRPRKNPKTVRKRSVNVPIWIRGENESGTISSVIVQDPSNIFKRKIKREKPDKDAPCEVRHFAKIKKEPGVNESSVLEGYQRPIKQEPSSSPEYSKSEESDTYSPSEDGRTPVFCSKQTLNGKHVSYVISADNIRR